MGCFNVYCGISNISIGCGDDTVLLLLSNFKVGELTPAFRWLPIYGKYNHYGRLEDIERNKNVEILEKHYGSDIETIISNHMENLPFDKCDYLYMSRPVYEEMGKNLPIYKWSYEEYDMGNKFVLETLGFTFIEKTKDERYNLLYRHPSGIEYKSDGTWIGGNIYDLDSLPKEIDTTPLRGKNNIDFFRETYDIAGAIKEIDELEEEFKDIIDMDERIAKISRWSFELGKLRDRGIFKMIQSSEEGHNMKLFNSYFSHILHNDDLDDELIKLWRFIGNSYAINTPILPYRIYGTQDGMYKVHDYFLTKFQEINAREIYDDDEDDE